MRKSFLIIAIVTFMCLLALSRVVGLTHQSLWYDEGYTLTAASAGSYHDFKTHFDALTPSEHAQPLYYFLIFAWSRVAGSSDFALRLPSAIFSVISGLAAVLAAYFLGGTRRKLVMVVSAAAIFASSFSIYYAQEARPYALLQMLSFSLIALWLYAQRESSIPGPTLSSEILLGIVCLLCLVSSPLTAILVLSLAFSGLIVSSERKNWFRIWRITIGLYLLAGVAGFVTLLHSPKSPVAVHNITRIRQPLWMNVGYTLSGIAYGITLPPAADLLRGPHKLRVVLSYWPYILPAVLVLGCLCLGVILLIRNAKGLPKADKVIFVALLLYAIVLFGFLGEIVRLNVLPRHASALFTLIFLAVVACGNLSMPSSSRFARTVFQLGIVGWFLINVVSLNHYWRDPSFRKDDYRETAILLENYPLPTFIVSGWPELLERNGKSIIDATQQYPDTLAQFVQTQSGPSSQVILIFNEFRNYRWAKTHRTVEQVMAPVYDCQAINHLSNIDIYSCRLNTSHAVSVERTVGNGL